jgi:hypothetical protein
VNMKLKGERQLKKFMRELPKKVKKVQRAAVRSMATPVLKEARKQSPKRTGALKKSLGKRVRTYGSHKIVAIVGPRNGKAVEVNGKLHDPAKIAHIVEDRTPFLLPAYESSKGDAQEQYADKLRERIKKEAAKARAKAR